jgi:Xaa-Pro dipeptidase
MNLPRRRFLETAALGSVALATGCADAPPAADAPQAASTVPAAIKALTPMTAGVVPITDDERRTRISKAQKLMTDAKLDAVFMEGTTSCYYFTGMRWGQSERTFGVVLPRQGDLAYVCPGFEEDRARELINAKLGSEVRVWQEDESPYAVIAGLVKDRGLTYHRIGIEERVRFFIADGIRRAAPGVEVTDAVSVTAGCRMIKSKAEIALLQRANDVTLAAYKTALTTMHEGMPQGELADNIMTAFRTLGYPGFVSVQFGKWTALPHGSSTPQTLKTGDIVMVDDGVTVEGYAADITRTVVFGTPTKRQREIWNLEKRAQAAAFDAIKIGAPCESVDAAARKVLVDAGFGPGYKVPGLPHRTGHGIGLDGHEWTNFVKGNTTPIQIGMCFSDEPTIAIPGEFGIRLEDCLYIGDDGPHFFSQPSKSIDDPFG